MVMLFAFDSEAFTWMSNNMQIKIVWLWNKNIARQLAANGKKKKKLYHITEEKFSAGDNKQENEFK